MIVNTKQSVSRAFSQQRDIAAFTHSPQSNVWVFHPNSNSPPEQGDTLERFLRGTSVTNPAFMDAGLTSPSDPKRHALLSTNLQADANVALQ